MARRNEWLGLMLGFPKVPQSHRSRVGSQPMNKHLLDNHAAWACMILLGCNMVVHSEPALTYAHGTAKCLSEDGVSARLWRM